MSEELEWELYDIFASGIFAFPVYEHNSARRIVRYLLMRGVPAEDVAAAIEDHAVDLRSWLERRPGHHMVGEWVMAWLNDSRDQYKADRRDRRLVYRLRRTVCAAGNRYPTAYQNRANFDDIEPFYGVPMRGMGDYAFDDISTTTASTASSDSGSDNDEDDDSSATYQSRNASFSRRKSSPHTGSVASWKCARRTSSRTLRKGTFDAAPESSFDDVRRNDSDCSISGQLVEHCMGNDDCLPSLTATTDDMKSDESVSELRLRKTGSESNLSTACRCIEFGPPEVAHRISRSCPNLIKPSASSASSPLGLEIEHDKSWLQSHKVSKDTFQEATVHTQMSSSFYDIDRPSSVNDADVSKSVEYPALHRQRSVSSSSCVTVAAASVGRESLPDPPDSGNVSDIQCNCTASVCCGGGVGYEHNCPSPIAIDDETLSDVAVDRFPMTSFPSLPTIVVTDHQPVPFGANEWLSNCDRYPDTFSHYVDDQSNSEIWCHQPLVRCKSTSNMSTPSICCRRNSSVNNRSQRIHDAFPIS